MDLGLSVGLDQQIHRPIRLIIVHRLEPRQGDIVGDPFGGGQLRHRIDGPVGDHREDHPLHRRGELAAPQHLAQRGVDPQLAPQTIQQPRHPRRPRPDHRQALTGCVDRVARVVCFAQVAVDRTDEAA